MAPNGRAFLKGCAWTPTHEEPSAEYPLMFTTGRTVYQFHTRTKTARSRSLNEAAPDAWVELNPGDAHRYGITEGDLVRVESPRGAIEVKARIGNVISGAVFAPFHYGTWDLDSLDPHQPASPAGGGQALPGDGPREEVSRQRQANELTMTVWDPVSKQPYFKTAACRVRKVADATGPSSAPTTAASAPATNGARTDLRADAHGETNTQSVAIPVPTSGGAPTISRAVPTPWYPNDPACSTSELAQDPAGGRDADHAGDSRPVPASDSDGVS